MCAGGMGCPGRFGGAEAEGGPRDPSRMGSVSVICPPCVRWFTYEVRWVPTDRLLLHPKACLRLPPAEVNVSLGFIDGQKLVKHFTPLSRPCRVRGRLTFILQLMKQSEGPSEMYLQKGVEE